MNISVTYDDKQLFSFDVKNITNEEVSKIKTDIITLNICYLYSTPPPSVKCNNKPVSIVLQSNTGGDTKQRVSF